MDSWKKLAEDARLIRQEVFVIEQNVPVALEWDDMDEPSLHAVARDTAGRAVGTGRLLPDGHIGRMAVLKPWRGRGIGAAILEALIEQARLRGMTQVMLHAQTHAEAFYAAHGFAREGDVFMEADIPHVFMRRSLANSQ